MALESTADFYSGLRARILSRPKREVIVRDYSAEVNVSILQARVAKARETLAEALVMLDLDDGSPGPCGAALALLHEAREALG